MIANVARWFGLAALALVLLAGLAFAGAWLFVTYDKDALRTNLEAALENALDRDVDIGGEIDLHMALRPTVALSDIKVANADWGADRPMLEIGTLKAGDTSVLTEKLAIVYETMEPE